MKVVGFNGSPRKNGNTALLLKRVCSRLEAKGIETEILQIGGTPVRGCTACLTCIEKKNNHCIIESDIVNECIKKMSEAEGILIGSPTYFASLTPETKGLIDRAGFVCRANGGLFRHKVGAGVAAVRRAGALNVFNAINHFFLISDMFVPGSSYWNLGIGRAAGEVADDEEGMETMDQLGDNMALLLEKLYR